MSGVTFSFIDPNVSISMLVFIGQFFFCSAVEAVASFGFSSAGLGASTRVVAGCLESPGESLTQHYCLFLKHETLANFT